MSASTITLTPRTASTLRLNMLRHERAALMTRARERGLSGLGELRSYIRRLRRLNALVAGYEARGVERG